MTTVLLTGATGFVGSRLRPVLDRRGLHVRCLSRDAARAERRFPGSEWVQADLADDVAVRKAMQDCDAAYYLVHEMGTGGDYREREAAAARLFARAAANAGLRRIIYLGGVAPGPGRRPNISGAANGWERSSAMERCPCWSYEPA